jgi:uncharacterized membrane protein YvlD (DUF360 family)
MNPWLLAATAGAFVSFSVHTFVGGRFAARPLLHATSLPKATIWLNYFTWHIVTALLLVLAGVFGAGAFGRIDTDAVLVCAAIAALISVISIAVTLKAGIQPYRFPASYLLGATAAFAFMGALG